MNAMIKNGSYIRLCRARDFLRDGSQCTVTVAAAAREAHLSHYHFIRAFASAFGQTPNEFRTQVRLDRAKELLIVGDRSITEVCLELGYSSVGSFTTLFAKNTGLAPTEYRRQLRARVRVPGVFPPDFVPHCFASMYLPL
jgi:AraC-like DNA-binding protein